LRRDTDLEATIVAKYAALSPLLNERARRLWAAAESVAIGYGGDAVVSSATGLSRTTIRSGRREVAAGGAPAGRLRVGAEVARADSTTRKRLANVVRGRLAWMRQLVPQGRPRAVADKEVIGSAACMLGGVILARAVGGKEASAILSACREFIHEREG